LRRQKLHLFAAAAISGHRPFLGDFKKSAGFRAIVLPL
jgi:hypothetical protein